MNRIILLDRDGVINYDSINYIKSVNEFIFYPGSVEAIAQLNLAGYRIGIATNQSGIARHLYTIADLNAIHDKMLKKIHETGGEIEAIEYCPHHPDEHCYCRKPNPGMLIALGKRLDCDLTNVTFLGDKISDLQAAEAVGAKPILITEADSEVDKLRQQHYPLVPRFDSLAAYVKALLPHHKN